jgi:hypothetical protein
MSLEQLSFPSNKCGPLYINNAVINATVNGVAPPSVSQDDFNSGSIGCIINSATCSVYCSMISGFPTAFVAIEVFWRLGGGISTGSTSTLFLTATLPAQFIPAFTKVIPGFVTFNTVKIPAQLQIDTAGGITVLNTANSAGTFATGTLFNFVNIGGVYSLAT